MCMILGEFVNVFWSLFIQLFLCGDDTTYLAFRDVSETFHRLHVRNQFVIKPNAFAIAEIAIQAMTPL